MPPEEYEKARAVFDILNKNWGTDADIKAGLDYLANTSLFAALADENLRDAAFGRAVLGPYAALLSAAQVREKLGALAVDAYDWADNPQARDRVRQLAEAEYNAGGSDRVLRKIDAMDDALLKRYLKRLVRDNMRVGIEILGDRGETEGGRRDA